MANISFDGKKGRIKSSIRRDTPKERKSVGDVVREIKEGMKKPAGEDYRERALAMHGLVCARCGREFDSTNRHLLTVHHRDGNHHNNPPDGSNWENLCAYCHEDVHSRGVLSEHASVAHRGKEEVVVYKGESAGGDLGSLGAKLQQALSSKRK